MIMCSYKEEYNCLAEKVVLLKCPIIMCLCVFRDAKDSLLTSLQGNVFACLAYMVVEQS